MVKRFESFNRRRLRSSYFGVVVSISLVLYLLGFLAVLVYNADNLSRTVKENFTITVLIQPEANDMNVRQYQKMVAALEGVKSTTFISKDEAAETLIEELDEDFLEYLGTNPLTDAIDIFLEGDYVEMAFLETFKARLADENIVHEILIDEDLAEQVYSNLQRISLFLLLGVALLTVISFFLINSSIQLAIYSRRFIIKTMQLVGATRGFIRMPFLRTGSLHGVLGAIFATSLLYLSLYYINMWIPELEIHQQWNFLALVPVGLLVIGIGISWICTYFAVRKYLNLKTDDLYY